MQNSHSCPSTEWAALENNESPHPVIFKQKINNTWPGVSWRDSNSRKMTKVDHVVFLLLKYFTIVKNFQYQQKQRKEYNAPLYAYYLNSTTLA